MFGSPRVSHHGRASRAVVGVDAKADGAWRGRGVFDAQGSLAAGAADNVEGIGGARGGFRGRAGSHSRGACRRTLSDCGRAHLDCEVFDGVQRPETIESRVALQVVRGCGQGREKKRRGSQTNKLRAGAGEQASRRAAGLGGAE